MAELPVMCERRASFDLLQAERAFRAMGTDAHVVIWQHHDPLIEPDILLDQAQDDLTGLERLWSRFVPTSDVCRLNAGGGTMVPVAPETIDLLELANLAHTISQGRFDATLLRELENAGYDRPFDGLSSPRRSSPLPSAGRASGLASVITVDRTSGAAACPSGRGIDLGGIGKGRAADIVACRLLQQGALGACVNVGGDLRVVGETPGGTGIGIVVEDPFGDGQISLIEARNVGLATSARTRRRWETPLGDAHHLIDPTTGAPRQGSVAAVTAIASSAAWAEVVAKTVFLGATLRHPRSDRAMSAPCLLVGDDASVTRIGGFEAFER